MRRLAKATKGKAMIEMKMNEKPFPFSVAHKVDIVSGSLLGTEIGIIVTV
jgi:hypothetical protein